MYIQYVILINLKVKELGLTILAIHTDIVKINYQKNNFWRKKTNLIYFNTKLIWNIIESLPRRHIQVEHNKNC